MCEQLAQAFTTSPVELRQHLEYIDFYEPLAEHVQPFAHPFDYQLGNADLVTGTKYTVYGIRLRGVLTCPPIARYTNSPPEIEPVLPLPTPYKCRVIVGVDHQPENTGDPFYFPYDETSIRQLLDLSNSPSSWPMAPRRIDSYKRFTILADKLFCFNPHTVVYRSETRGEMVPNGPLIAFNHVNGDDEKSSRFVHDTDGSVLGQTLPLSTDGTVEGPGVGVNVLTALTVDPNRDVEVAGVVSGEPFEVTGSFDTYSLTKPTHPEFVYPVTQKVDFDIPFTHPVDVMIAPKGFRCALTNRFVFWIVSDMSFADTTPLPTEAYTFHFQGFTELYYVDY